MAFRIVKAFFVFVLFLCFQLPIFAQLRFDTIGWRAPVDIPIFLSGNYCELRAGHFHAGIDIKTQGTEGFKVYAVNKGYISRIKIASGGYGKSLYITHPDGYTSVYAHLKEFNIQLEKYIKAIQYQRESFEVDVYPQMGELPVAKGDIIALTGNSGSSGGPHLHFEIRETANSVPMNGLFLGYDIKDNLDPDMDYLYVYPQDANSWVSRKNESHFYNLKKVNGRYKLNQGDTLQASGSIGLGLKVDDLLNESTNRCGVYWIKIFVNDTLYFHEQFDGVSFAESRYVNSLMDYKESIEKKRKLYKLFIDPNNKLSVYKKEVNRGIIELRSKGVSKVTIQAVDAYFNKSELTFYLEFNPEKKTQYKSSNSRWIIPWQKSFQLDTAGISISIPKEALYDTLNLEFSIDTGRMAGGYSNTYKIHNPFTPIHEAYEIRLNYDAIAEPFKDKLVVTMVGEKEPLPLGGIEKNGMIYAQVRELGTYYLAVDTIAPKIIPVGALAKSNELSNAQFIQFKITDNLSGIKKLRGSINGKWVLFEWDPKKDSYRYEMDEFTPKNGTFEVLIEATDERGNKAVYMANCTRNLLEE
ncbi:MAG: M23 family metallopeptidase [Salinivirgaceae bacterium]